MEGIPREICIPAKLSFRSKLPTCPLYFENILKDVSCRFGMRVVEDDGLKFPTPLSFSFRIGSLLCGFDFNDLPQLPPAAGNYDVWYKTQTTSSHVPYGNVQPFPPVTFSDWRRYRELEKTIRYSAASETILCVHNLRISTATEQWTDDLRRRRHLVSELLHCQYGDLVDDKFAGQVEYWSKASKSLVSVHVPGLWNNMLGSSQLQLFAFGVCTISPYIHTWVSDEGPPVPNEHYIVCRDDYSDLVERIEWCRSNKEDCRRIGVAAKLFFQSHCLPESIMRTLGTYSVSRLMAGV